MCRPTDEFGWIRHSTVLHRLQFIRCHGRIITIPLYRYEWEISNEYFLTKTPKAKQRKRWSICQGIAPNNRKSKHTTQLCNHVLQFRIQDLSFPGVYHTDPCVSVVDSCQSPRPVWFTGWSLTVRECNALTQPNSSVDMVTKINVLVSRFISNLTRLDFALRTGRMGFFLLIHTNQRVCAQCCG